MEYFSWLARPYWSRLQWDATCRVIQLRVFLLVWELCREDREIGKDHLRHNLNSSRGLYKGFYIIGDNSRGYYCKGDTRRLGYGSFGPI